MAERIPGMNEQARASYEAQRKVYKSLAEGGISLGFSGDQEMGGDNKVYEVMDVTGGRKIKVEVEKGVWRKIAVGVGARVVVASDGVTKFVSGGQEGTISDRDAKKVLSKDQWNELKNARRRFRDAVKRSHGKK